MYFKMFYFKNVGAGHFEKRKHSAGGIEARIFI